MGAAKKNLDAAISLLRKALQELAASDSATAGNAKAVLDQKIKIDSQSRQLRTEIEGLQQGAGAVTRQAQQLRERKAAGISEGRDCGEEEFVGRIGPTERCGARAAREDSGGAVCPT